MGAFVAQSMRREEASSTMTALGVSSARENAG
jgi:hypothetical protein